MYRSFFSAENHVHDQFSTQPCVFKQLSTLKNNILQYFGGLVIHKESNLYMLRLVNCVGASVADNKVARLAEIVVKVL